MADDELTKVAVPLLWVGADELPVLAANQLITQVDGDYIYLHFGHATPPVILGDAEQRQEQLEQLEYVPVRPIVRLAVSRRHLGEVIELLQGAAENYDNYPRGEQ